MKNNLRKEIAKSIRRLKVGKVQTDIFADKSSSWINWTHGTTIIEITFDPDGQQITGIETFSENPKTGSQTPSLKIPAV